MAVIHPALGVEVIQLSPSEWRVSDMRHADQQDGLSLLGFIEQRGQGFEITVIGAPGKRTRFRDFTEALEWLATRRDRSPQAVGPVLPPRLRPRRRAPR
ncbi:hypothetical protein [Leifsonia poae]|uniref:Uncharacterized protein n=1 Tax=Leifsonia poae TaxID=110933 RepID=A0A9W6HAS8_9MICO|nr:hypothetical protein [Leifsonia poae]GLJ77089.1 hypothetical protein GCM10017584_26630 [Leifsonia poae]